MKRKNREGIVYSTNPDFMNEPDQNQEAETLPASKQNLKVMRESKGRKGKTVTLIEGFIGNTADMEKLAKDLKQFCGTGGSCKDGVIVIQGDLREKVMQFLSDKGYKTKRAGG